MGGIDGEVELDHLVELDHGAGAVLALDRGVGLVDQPAGPGVVEIPVRGVDGLGAQHGVVHGFVAALGPLDQGEVGVLVALAVGSARRALLFVRRTVTLGVTIAGAIVPSGVEAAVGECHGSRILAIHQKGGVSAVVYLAGEVGEPDAWAGGVLYLT